MVMHTATVVQAARPELPNLLLSLPFSLHPSPLFWQKSTRGPKQAPDWRSAQAATLVPGLSVPVTLLPKKTATYCWCCL